MAQAASAELAERQFCGLARMFMASEPGSIGAAVSDEIRREADLISRGRGPRAAVELRDRIVGLGYGEAADRILRAVGGQEG